MHIVIIGNGIAGITTARHVRKHSDHDITVISSETDFFWSRTALMYIFMGHMKFDHTKPYEDWFWKKNRINLMRKYVTAIQPDQKTISFAEGGDLKYDKLVLATGSRSNRYGWPGQDLAGVQGMVSYQDLLSMEQYARDTKRAVVVGGGLIGIEMAEMFHSRHIPVTFLVREDSFWNRVMPPEESAMINRAIRRHGIDLRLQSELKEILPDDNGRVRAVVTSEGEEIACEFVGLTAGVSPNISLADSAGVETGRGFVLHSGDYRSSLHTMKVKGGYGMTATLDILEEIACGRGPESALMMLGYAGWGPGQLEGEIARNGWLTAEASPQIVFQVPAGAKWSAALESIGVDPIGLSATAGRA